VDEDKNADPFHDGEADIYDLYIACDGAVRDDGLLDVDRLKQFSPDESEALDVPRLIEIWLHTEQTRCPRCAMIVSTLNLVRETLGESAEDDSEEQIQSAGADAADPNT
jgi:hypothetical protein